MVQAMLRAQGLDLAEDEMDDAISSLIDELDGAESKVNAAASMDGAVDDFDNFDDFGMSEEDKTSCRLSGVRLVLYSVS